MNQNTKKDGSEQLPSNTGADISETSLKLRTGDRIGDYVVLRFLGGGWMGQVYLVQHRERKTRHALKLLPREFSESEGFAERFFAEKQVVKGLEHPHIVKIQEMDVDSGRYYIVSDFISLSDGELVYDLQEAIMAAERLPPETVHRLMLQICEGLEYAHANGVVHLDLKPSNVLLTSSNPAVADVRICDFGVARIIGNEQIRRLVAARSVESSILGTFLYMSPEQAEGSLVDVRSDIYSLGMMMYRMLTGHRMMGIAQPASKLISELDRVWDKVIDKCLQYKPEERWQSVAELHSALLNIAFNAQSRKSKRKKGIRFAAAFALFLVIDYVSHGLFMRQADEQSKNHPENAVSTAEAARGQADQARQRAVKERAPEYSSDLFAVGTNLCSCATKDYAAGEFTTSVERWREAMNFFSNACVRAVSVRDALYEGALASRKDADDARQAAEDARASEYAASLFINGSNMYSCAAAEFGGCEFEDASNLWAKATAKYVEAKDQSITVQKFVYIEIWNTGAIAVAGDAPQKWSAASGNGVMFKLERIDVKLGESWTFSPAGDGAADYLGGTMVVPSDLKSATTNRIFVKAERKLVTKTDAAKHQGEDELDNPASDETDRIKSAQKILHALKNSGDDIDSLWETAKTADGGACVIWAGCYYWMIKVNAVPEGKWHGNLGKLLSGRISKCLEVLDAQGLSDSTPEARRKAVEVIGGEKDFQVWVGGDPIRDLREIKIKLEQASTQP